jgi:hypothetical protein
MLSKGPYGKALPFSGVYTCQRQVHVFDISYLDASGDECVICYVLNASGVWMIYQMGVVYANIAIKPWTSSRTRLN